MSDDLIKVRLISPTKVGGRWLKQGDEHVSADEKAALEDAGLIALETLVGHAEEVRAAEGDAFDEAAFNAAVNAAAQKMAYEVFDGALAQLEAELKGIIADGEKLSSEKLAAEQGVATLSSRVEQLEQQLDAERQNAADLVEKLTAAQAENAAMKAGATAAAQDTPPSSAAKTAPKKGVAATKG